MFTIISTACLDALRERAEKAEADLAALRQQDSARVQDLARMDAELARACAEIGDLALRLRTAEAQLQASMAARAEDWRIYWASVQDRERTIAILRERPAVEEPTVPALPENTVMLYRTAGGSVVAVVRTSRDDIDEQYAEYAWRCLGCTEAQPDYLKRERQLSSARTNADRHAADCRAVPVAPAVSPAPGASAVLDPSAVPAPL
ncbi:hypothetical protein [Kitasatospora sp. NPDC088134]|uniref:hypothetical protein n=1 Tax=Kitasatospora sp. NPDC088134 TaxID=3364071 RepID=UPI0037F3308B